MERLAIYGRGRGESQTQDRALCRRETRLEQHKPGHHLVSSREIT